MAKTVPVRELRSDLAQLLDEVTNLREHIVVTRRGRPAAVLIPLDEYDASEEPAELLSDPGARAAATGGDRWQSVSPFGCEPLADCIREFGGGGGNRTRVLQLLNRSSPSAAGGSVSGLPSSPARVGGPSQLKCPCPAR